MKIYSLALRSDPNQREIDPVRGAENNDGRAVGAESAAHGIGARVIREFRHRIERTDAERGDETRDV